MKFLTKSVLAALGSMAIIGSAQADVQHLDDVIIDGSACVGFDCVNGESFGFDTLRLKENNLRVHFDDTSNSASFPNNDWRLVANDTGNGGTNHFSVEDSSAGRSPFRIEAGAPANALVVEADGDVGIKTLNPVVDLHIVEGNTPTVRLDQDGSDGFTPQTWDIAGNEANFFIRDVTNGSRLSFRIRPGAPESSIDIASDGDIGMGTSSPSSSLHIRNTDGSTKLFLEEASSSPAARDMLSLTNNGGPRIVMTDTSSGNAFWRTSVENNANNFVITRSGTGLSEFTLDNNGNLTLRGTLNITGGCSGCDAVFDPSYELKSIEEHASMMWENSYLPAVGPTADLPVRAKIDVFQKTAGILNELEHAHIYIEQLNSKLKVKESQLEKMAERLDKIEQQLGSK